MVHLFDVPSQTWIWDYFETHQERVLLLCTAFETTNRPIVCVITLRLGIHFASLDTRELVSHCTHYESVNLVIMSKIWR